MKNFIYATPYRKPVEGSTLAATGSEKIQMNGKKRVKNNLLGDNPGRQEIGQKYFPGRPLAFYTPASL